MPHDPRRAGLSLLCAVAVLFGASLFPATGLGTAPSVDDGAGPAVPDGDRTDAPPERTPADTETTTATTEPSPEPTPDDATATATTTAASTNESTPGTEDGALPPWIRDLAAVASYLVVIAVMVLALLVEPRSRRFLVDRLPLPDPVEAVVSATGRRLSQVTMQVVFAAAGGARAAARVLRRLVGGGLTGAGALLAAFARTIAGVPSVFGTGASGALAGLFGSLRDVPGSVERIARGTTDRGSAADDGPLPHDRPGSDASAEDADAGPPSIEDAWAALTEAVRVENPDARTPAEFARAAVDAGLPAEPVRRLTRVFRDVTYGGRPRTEDRIRAAREALARIESDGDGDGGTPGREPADGGGDR